MQVMTLTLREKSFIVGEATLGNRVLAQGVSVHLAERKGISNGDPTKQGNGRGVREEIFQSEWSDELL
jgi:hypothetical protein